MPEAGRRLSPIACAAARRLSAAGVSSSSAPVAGPGARRVAAARRGSGASAPVRRSRIVVNRRAYGGSRPRCGSAAPVGRTARRRSRTGAAGQITAIDDAVKATNTEVLSIEFPRDTKGWGGHGNYIVIGGNDVSDVRHAIELGLELTKKNAGELYISESGHLEFTYSASAGAALQKAFHAVPGEAFGFMAGSPAAIGLVMADTAMKASAVNITCYMTPSIGTSHSNEVILGISGDASAVKAAVLEARQVGLELLIGMGSYPEIPGTPYL